jgi:NADH:ubiquinone oxidoreductase subunit E
MDEDLQVILSEFDGKKEEIIPILQKVQDAYTYLPEESMNQIARFIQVPQSRVYGVATFYAQFRFTPTGKNIVSICRGTACHVRGAPAILEETTAILGLDGEGTTEDKEYTVETVACIGCCALAPCVTVNEEVHGNLSKKKVRTILAKGSKSNGG